LSSNKDNCQLTEFEVITMIFRQQQRSLIQRLSIISAISLIIFVLPILATKVAAQNLGDPKTLGCMDDAKTSDQEPKSYQDGIFRREVNVELRYSPKCKAVWNKSNEVIKDSILWLEQEGDNRRLNEFQVQHRGSYYTSAVDVSKPVKACVSIPSLNEPVCTRYWKP
jgi:Zn-finger nucleic acid-binding protein